MTQEDLQHFEDRAIYDAGSYFDRIAKDRPELPADVVARLAIVAAIEFQTAVLRRAIEETPGGETPSLR